MSRRKNDVFAQAIVGLFMIVVVALLAYFTIVISGIDVLSGKSKTRMTIQFDAVGGLKDHDSVMYRGTKVGIVEKVAVTSTNLLVRISIDENVVLRESYRITVCSLSMLGGNYLMLEEGSGEKLDLVTTLFRGETPSDWMRDVSRITKNMDSIMNREELHQIISNVAAVAERARAIADKTDAIITRVEHGEGMIGKLMSSNGKLYDDVEQTVNNAREITEKIKQGEGLAGRLLAKDDHTLDDLRDGIAAFRKACESFDMGDAKTDVKAAVVDVRAVIEKGGKLIENLNAVAENLRNGKGTLGRLANEDGMYSEVEGLIRDCRQIIDNYRDTTPISTFSSLATGAL